MPERKVYVVIIDEIPASTIIGKKPHGLNKAFTSRVRAEAYLEDKLPFMGEGGILELELDEQE